MKTIRSDNGANLHSAKIGERSSNSDRIVALIWRLGLRRYVERFESRPVRGG
jgi:hypothetical protein